MITGIAGTRMRSHITQVLADPALIRAEIARRLAQIGTADPATAAHQRLDDALGKTAGAITWLIGAKPWPDDQAVPAGWNPYGPGT